MERPQRIIDLRSIQLSPPMWRLVALLLLVGIIAQVAAPLETDVWHVHVAYWGLRLVLLVAGLRAGAWIAGMKPFAGRGFGPRMWWGRLALIPLVACLVLTLGEIVLDRSFPVPADHIDDDLPPLLAFLSEYLTVASVLLPLNLMVWLTSAGIEAIVRTETRIPVPVPTPEFLGRLGDLAPREVIALGAEEHYVRVHSAQGDFLLHYRFGRAVEELDDRFGLRVHRSWWVARSAVTGSRRQGKKWLLRLSNGMEVPVSATYLPEVRRAGLLNKVAA